KPGGRVVGLLSFGLNLERDVVSALEPVDLGARGSERFEIAGKVKVVLIDERNQWVWHPDVKGRLNDDRPGARLPHDYPALARARLRLIAVGLWAGLVVVRRRLEFASHG